MDPAEEDPPGLPPYLTHALGMDSGLSDGLVLNDAVDLVAIAQAKAESLLTLQKELIERDMQLEAGFCDGISR